MLVYCLLVYGLLVHRCVDTLPAAIMSPQFLHTKLSLAGVALFSGVAPLANFAL